MGKKKVGCVIAYNEGHNNYGTSLQGYATIKKIRDLGYECEMIIYKKNLSLFQKGKLIIMMILCGGTKSKIRSLNNRFYKLTNSAYAKNISVRTKAVNQYKEKKLKPFFKEYHGYKALCEGSLNYGAVLVGSDQVWTPMGLYGKFFNLLFVDDKIPKIAYASSFGVSHIPSMQLAETKKYLNRFDWIGVRELKGKEIVETISDNKAKVVVDPTLLLTKDEWMKEIQSIESKHKEPYIFCYFLGNNPNARQAINDLKKKSGIKIVNIRHMDEYISTDEHFGDEAPYDVSPDDFVKYISEAAYVCTDSFHCTIFAILFHRKFMTFYRFSSKSKNSRNSRIDSLFSLLGLEDRLFKGVVSGEIEKEIDYNSVDNKIEELRLDSLDFLQKSLESAR